MNLDQGFGDAYRVNWFTPYLLGYAVARGFAELVGVVAALKLVLSVAGLVTKYAAVRLLLRIVGAERWLALFAFPFFFMNAFYWGFLSFLAAVPVGLFSCTWLFCFRFAEEAERALGVCPIALGGTGALLCSRYRLRCVRHTAGGPGLRSP